MLAAHAHLQTAAQEQQVLAWRKLQSLKAAQAQALQAKAALAQGTWSHNQGLCQHALLTVIRVARHV
jgi:hypothetical protein